jgi:hypothetical protein
MTIRRSIVAGCLASAALLPGTALAQEEQVGRVVEELNDPANQLAMSAMLVAMSEALLDMDVAPLKKMAEATGADTPLRDLPPDARLRDLVGPDADRMQQDLARRTPEMMGRMAGMAGALGEMLPQLRAMADRMKDAMPR